VFQVSSRVKNQIGPPVRNLPQSGRNLITPWTRSFLHLVVTQFLVFGQDSNSSRLGTLHLARLLFDVTQQLNYCDAVFRDYKRIFEQASVL